MDASLVWKQSDGEVTRAYYAELEKRGPIGLVAMNLFRANKCSVRAKNYRGGDGNGSYRSQAYNRKQWSIENLVKILLQHADRLNEIYGLNIQWGWKRDPSQEYHAWVIYISLPQGQVSFHTAIRGKGPDYPGDWDGMHLSTERICAFCNEVFALKAVA